MAKRNLPFELYFDNNGYDNSLNYYVKEIPYFQKIVDKFNQLKIEYKLQKNDLQELCLNTKVFLTEKIMSGESLQVGGLSLSKDKLFDLIEAPERYLEFIEYINTVKSELKQYISNSDFILNDSTYFEITNNFVQVKQSIVDSNKQSYTILIDTKEKLEALELLEDIAEKITKLTNLKPHFSTMQTLENYFIYDHYKINEKDTVIKVNPNVFKNIF